MRQKMHRIQCERTLKVDLIRTNDANMKATRQNMSYCQTRSKTLSFDRESMFYMLTSSDHSSSW